MYLWKTDKLIEDLAHGRVSERDQFNYLFVTIAILSASYGIELTPWEVVYGVVVAALGLIAGYWINRRGDDRDYLIRYICLGIPVTVRTLVFALGGLLLLDLAASAIYVGVHGVAAAQDLSAWLDHPAYVWLGVLLTEIFLYWQLLTAIHRVSRLKKSHSA